MDFTEENDIPGLSLFIDFEKALDSVSWNFQYKVINFFKFGPGVIDWVKTFYNDISSGINIGVTYQTFFYLILDGFEQSLNAFFK